MGKLDVDIILGFDVTSESEVDQLVRYIGLGNQIEGERDGRDKHQDECDRYMK